MAKSKKNKKKKKKRSRGAQPPAIGRLGAEQWLAVRQKSGAGPIEPKPRRGTRAQRLREAVEREGTEPQSEARDGNDG